MYKKLLTKKWRFQLGGGFPTQGIDGVQNLGLDELGNQIDLYNQQLQMRTQQGTQQNVTTLPTTPENIVAQQVAQTGVATNPVQNSNTTEGIVSTLNQSDTGQITSDSSTPTTETPSTSALMSPNTFSSQDYVKGAMTGISSLQNAKLDDGKITGDEIGSSALDAAAGMSGPYGQVANAAITVGENLLGDELYQGLGEGVEYEKGASRFGKGALKGAGVGAKVGGPLGSVIGSVVGGGINLLGQGRRKNQAMEEFEKRRDERIRNMNQQSKNIYADQYQTFYKKGGKAIIKIKEQNKGRFTLYCKGQGYTGVTQECIDKAKKSNSTSLKKQAVFAENVHSFKK